MSTETTAKKHSMLSPSSSNIWLHCTPSAAMMSLLPREDTVFTAAGTEAHALAEYKVRTLVMGEDIPDVRPALTCLDEEMEICTDKYAEFAAGIIQRAMDKGFIPEITVENVLDLTAFIPNGKGTADMLITAGDTLCVVDFKYGENCLVHADHNSQMMIYALGAQEKLRANYGRFSRVQMTIFQPRMGNISTSVISMDELEVWKNDVLLPMVALAAEGEGELVEGRHCEFCSAKLLCRKKRADFVERLTQLRTKKDYMDINKVKKNMLSTDEIAEVIKLGAGIPYWVEQIGKFALEQALHGTDIPGFKLVADKAPSKLPESAAATLEGLGINPWKEKELKSKSAIEKEVGKKVYRESVEPLLEDGAERAKLVVSSDKGDAKDYTYFQKED